MGIDHVSARVWNSAKGKSKSDVFACSTFDGGENRWITGAWCERGLRQSPLEPWRGLGSWPVDTRVPSHDRSFPRRLNLARARTRCPRWIIWPVEYSTGLRSPVSSSIDRRNRSGEGSTQAYDVFGQIETWIAIDRGKRASKVSYESLSSIFEMMYSFLLKFFSPLLAINRGNDLRSLENEACIGEPRGRYGIVTVVVGVDSRLRRVTVPCLCCTSFPDRFRGGSGPRFLHEPREKRGETDTISRRGTFSLLDR